MEGVLETHLHLVLMDLVKLHLWNALEKTVLLSDYNPHIYSF